MARTSVLGQVLGYVKASNRWWLIPILFMLLTMGAILAFAQGSVLAPFIYTIF